MNDTIMIVGGVLILIVMAFGAGTIWRLATRRAKSTPAAPAVQQPGPTAPEKPYTG